MDVLRPIPKKQISLKAYTPIESNSIEEVFVDRYQVLTSLDLNVGIPLSDDIPTPVNAKHGPSLTSNSSISLYKASTSFSFPGVRARNLRQDIQSVILKNVSEYAPARLRLADIQKRPVCADNIRPGQDCPNQSASPAPDPPGIRRLRPRSWRWYRSNLCLHLRPCPAPLHDAPRRH